MDGESLENEHLTGSNVHENFLLPLNMLLLYAHINSNILYVITGQFLYHQPFLT